MPGGGGLSINAAMLGVVGHGRGESRLEVMLVKSLIA